MTGEESPGTRIRTFFLEPDIFFTNLAGQQPRYRWPLAIALVAGLCAAVATWLEMSWLSSFYTAACAGANQSVGACPSFLGIIVPISSVSAVFTPFVTLIVAGSGFYLLAGFVSKNGSLSHALTATGWGMVPVAVYEAVRIPLYLAFRPAMSVTVSPEFFTLLNNSSSASSMDNAAIAHMITPNQMYNTYALADAGLHVLAYLCCAWFWIPAIRNTCVVGYRQAVLIVLVPLLLFLAFSAGPVLVRDLTFLQTGL
jgi:hypothetical protein